MLTGMGQEEKVSGDYYTLAQKKPWAFRIPVMVRSETGEQWVVAGWKNKGWLMVAEFKGINIFFISSSYLLYKNITLLI